MLSKIFNGFSITGALSCVIVFQTILLATTTVHAYVDYTGCKKYNATGVRDPKGPPLIFIGETWDKKYYLMDAPYTTADYFTGAYNICYRFNMRLATIKTACEYLILESWFFSQFPTTYYAWIAGFRLGDSRQPPPFWCTTGEPLDFSQFGGNADYIQGPYPPGGYNPIEHSWINCLAVSRNCPVFTSGPTNPCEQTATYPPLQFMWLDCKGSNVRVICEQVLNYNPKEGNEIDDGKMD